MSSVQESLQKAIEHHRAGRLLEAEHFYRKVLTENPRSAQAMHLLGLLAFQAGKHEVALELVEKAARVDPFHVEYLIDLAEIYGAMNNIPKAIVCLGQVLKQNDQRADVWNSLGKLHRSAWEMEEAWTCFRESVRLDPKQAEAQLNLGEAYERRNMVREAQACFEEAVRLGPAESKHYFYLGTTFHEQGALLEAIACYQKALQLKPNAEGPTALLAEARLANGDFANGWPDFAAWQRFRYAGQRSGLPHWNGADLEGRKIWVHAQWGAGDVIQFIRYLPLIEARHGEPVVEVPARLIPLLRSSGFKMLVPAGSTPEMCHVQTHLIDLPMLFGTTFETIPGKVPYLAAVPESIASWRERLSSIPGYKVGIHWQGNPTYPADRCRSVELMQFAPLARVGGVTLVSLQKHHGLDQLAAIDGHFSLHDLGLEVDEGQGAFMGTAAVMKNLDLVITTDSSLAHLAGALGVEVWVVLSSACDWRWFSQREDSPWYPTMRLFRQTTPHEWSDVFERMAGELATRVRSR